MKKQPIDIETNDIEKDEIPSLQDILERKNDGKRPITLDGFFNLLDTFIAPFFVDVRKYSISYSLSTDKLLDSLRLSRKMIESMQANAGTQLLSDYELKIYVNTYAELYEIYDKIEQELIKIKSLENELGEEDYKIYDLKHKILDIAYKLQEFIR